MPTNIEIRNHLILPFGTARKFDLQKIRLSAVAANGIYLRSDIPCVYINVGDKSPLTMAEFGTVFETNHDPDDWDTSPCPVSTGSLNVLDPRLALR
jgi:hypothetical protein